MQFRLRSLFILTAVVAVTCGIAFAAPPYVALPILCTVLWVCPALWVNGIVYGRGAWRPFFIGGLMAGIGPHLAALYYSVVVVIQTFDSGAGELFSANNRGAMLLTYAVLLGPGFFALIGGMIGACVYWAFSVPPPPIRPTPTVTNDDYLVIEGRLTTQATNSRINVPRA